MIMPAKTIFFGGLMKRKTLLYISLISIIVILLCSYVFAINTSGAKIVKNSTIKTVTTVKPVTKTTPKPTVRVTQKATVKPTSKVTPRPTVKSTPRATAVPQKQTTKPMVLPDSSPTPTYTYECITDPGGSSTSSKIYGEQGDVIHVRVERTDGSNNKTSVTILVSASENHGLLQVVNNNVFAKYNESITSRCIGTINISYKNDNTGKTARITKEIVIDKHSNHKYGGWEIGPSNNVQIRRCSVCGYAETNIIHSPPLPPTSTQSPTPTPVPTPSPTPVPTPDANNHAFVAKTTWNMNSVNHWHACNYPGCNMDAHYDLSNMPNEARFSTHKYGGWENGPSNDTQVRRCAVCGYTESQEIFSVSINPQACTIREGNTQILTVNVRGYGNDKVTKTFSTSNTSIATVNRNGIVTARSYGTAEITVRGQVNGTGKVKTAKCVINVECAHRRTEKYYIEESDTKHREVRRCLSCSTIIEPSEPLLRDHTWSGRWVVRDIDANEYTHVCTKCGAFGGGTRIGYIEGSTTEHPYCASREWSYNKEFHWYKCVYPNCNMTSHKTIGNLPSDAGCKKHAFSGSGADQNICSVCGKTKQDLGIEPTPTPCVHNYIEFIYTYDPNPISTVDQPTSEGHFVEYKCEYCNQSDPARPKEQIPHSLNHFVKNGEDWHNCSYCNWENECQYEERNIVYTTTATCLSPGHLIERKSCLYCNNEIESRLGDMGALGHAYIPQRLEVAYTDSIVVDTAPSEGINVSSIPVYEGGVIDGR